MEIENSIETTKAKKSFFKSKAFIMPMIALMLIGIVSAAVYVYVSNTATMNLTVSQPLKVYLNDDPALTSLAIAKTTGDPIQFKINEDSISSSAVQVYNVLVEVTAPQNFDGTEFTSIKLTDDNGAVNQEVLGALKFITANGDYAAFSTIGSQNTKVARLMFATDEVTLSKYTHSAGLQKWSEITITPALGLASGNYSIKVCKVYNLVGATCL